MQPKTTLRPLKCQGNGPTCTWEVLVVVGVALCSGHPGFWIITAKHPKRSGCLTTLTARELAV